mgnify:CR=1 FL=1
MIPKSDKTLYFSPSKIFKFKLFSFCSACAFALFPFPSSSFPSPISSRISTSPKEVIDQVWQIIYRDYLDSSGKYNQDEWLSLRKILLSNQYIDNEEAYDSIRAMLSSLDDPYTRFMDPKEFEEMRIDTSGSLTGVGIQLSVDEETDKLTVISPIQGTPAFNAGVKPKDVILTIDGKSTNGMSINRAVELIRGEKGTTVTLGLMREGKSFYLELVRARVEILAVDRRINFTDKGVPVGYIRLKQFSSNSAAEMRDAILYLEEQNPIGYILDLRSNPGGLLEASIEIARQWIDEGTIVSTQTKEGINDVRRATGMSLTGKPLVVMVDSNSASASEILSGAIKDNGRGLLVGEQTYGKGLVQSVRGLSDGSGMTVTIARYLTPNGTDIHEQGIAPDIFASLTPEETLKLTSLDLGTRQDSQYRIAETTLIRAIDSSKSVQTYKYNTSNLESIFSYS